MAAAATFVRDPGGRARSLARAVNPIWAALTIAALLVTARTQWTVDPDVSWQLWIAHQLNGGVRLYRDISEANPPLWFWMGMPVDWLGGLIQVRSDHVLVIVIGLCAAFSLAATNRILDPIERPARMFILVYAALVLVAMPWAEFGQREQIALIGTLPYAALVGARRTNRAISARFAFMIGGFAAVGFALKDYFLLVPISLELWLVAASARRWRPIRPETVAILLVGIVYLAAFAWTARDFLTIELPLLLLAYGVTGAERMIDLFQPAVLTGAATLVLVVMDFEAADSERSGFAGAMAIAAMSFMAAYFVQAKGWKYQAIPFCGCAALALAALLTTKTKARACVLAAPALLCLPFWIAAEEVTPEPAYASDLSDPLRNLNAGDSVGFLATDPALGWSDTLQRRFRYPSRYYGFWMLRAVVMNEQAPRPDPRLTELGRRVVDQTVQDFRCLPPKRIIVARPTARAAKSGDFDILQFFLRDPPFVQLLSHYRPVERSNGLEVFEKMSLLGPGRDCIRRAQV